MTPYEEYQRDIKALEELIDTPPSYTAWLEKQYINMRNYLITYGIQEEEYE